MLEFLFYLFILLRIIPNALCRCSLFNATKNPNKHINMLDVAPTIIMSINGFSVLYWHTKYTMPIVISVTNKTCVIADTSFLREIRGSLCFRIKMFIIERIIFTNMTDM